MCWKILKQKEWLENFLLLQVFASCNTSFFLTKEEKMFLLVQNYTLANTVFDIFEQEHESRF